MRAENRRRLSISEFVNRSNRIHGSKYDYSLVNYANNSTRVTIICPVHGNFFQMPCNHLSGKGCQKCRYEKQGKDRRKSNRNFVSDARSIHGRRYDYSLVRYMSDRGKVDIICREHGKFSQCASNHLQGNGCPKCGISKISDDRRLTLESLVKRFHSVYGNLYDYSKSEYFGIHVRMAMTCNTHGEFHRSPCSHLNGYGCPSCSRKSIGENLIAHLLRSKKIEFIRQKTFPECRLKRRLQFDFYLPDFNAIIEYDGIQHFKSIEFWGGVKSYKKVQLVDAIKDSFALSSGILLIRIPYFEIGVAEFIIDRALKES